MCRAYLLPGFLLVWAPVGVLVLTGLCIGQFTNYMPFETKYMYVYKMYNIYIFECKLLTLHKVNGMVWVNTSDTEIC